MEGRIGLHVITYQQLLMPIKEVDIDIGWPPPILKCFCITGSVICWFLICHTTHTRPRKRDPNHLHHKIWSLPFFWAITQKGPPHTWRLWLCVTSCCLIYISPLRDRWPVGKGTFTKFTVTYWVACTRAFLASKTKTDW